MHGTVKHNRGTRPQRTAFAFLGQPLVCHALAATISLTWVRHGAYRIEVRHHSPLGPGPLIDAISYPDEQGARDEARRISYVYDTHATVREVQAAHGADAWLRPPCHRDQNDHADLTWLLAASITAARSVQTLPTDQRSHAWHQLRATVKAA